MEINMKLKTKLKIELLWSVMGGLLFSILPIFDRDMRFNIERWWGRMRFDEWGYTTVIDEFVVGFIFTYIFVKSLRRYNE
jgi:hypothetical protein